MKTLVLVGSGEFTESMIETDVNVINLAKKNSKRERISVAIIPTASVPDGKQKNWIDDGIQHFKKLRVNPFGLNIVNRKDANKKVFRYILSVEQCGTYLLTAKSITGILRPMQLRKKF